MADQTNLIQPSTAATTQQAKLELDEAANTLEPDDYIYLLAHIKSISKLVEPFYSSDSGPMQLLGTVTQERFQAGLVLNDVTRSIQLNYYPAGTPIVVFFGNEISFDTSKLRGGLVIPNDYYGKQVYKFNIYYQVNFHRIRHRPNHPALIPEAEGGILWENYKGTGSLKSWPVEYQVGYDD